MMGRRKAGLAALLLMLMAAVGLAGLLLPAGGGSAAGTDSASLGLVLLDRENGVYILAVSEGSAADQAGLLPGDCILHVAGDPLADAAAFDQLLKVGGPSLPMTIRRGTGEIHLTLPLR